MVLFYSSSCPFMFGNHLAKVERAGYFNYIVLMCVSPFSVIVSLHLVAWVGL